MKSNNIAHSPIRKGLISLVIFFAVFLSWAIFAPIESASIADGTIVLDFNHKTIQHLEGGIIDDILVKEGQEVKEGEVLLYMHDVKAKSDQEIAMKNLWARKIQRERLLAEKEGRVSLNLKTLFSELGNFPSKNEKELDDIINNQIKLFESRRSKISEEVKSLRDKIESLSAQKISAQKQLKILRKELKMVKPLVRENNLPMIRQYELEKQISEMVGAMNQATSEESSAEKQIEVHRHEDMSKIIDELKEVEIEIVNLTNQLASAKDILQRLEILAPVAGKVMNIKFHTVGAVIPPAAEIMTVVPQNDDLIIEAKIKPQDIDEVRNGLKTKIMLTAYKGKKVPKLNGEVMNVSPDIVISEDGKESYFLARVKVDEKDIAKLKSKIELYPGMPAQVFVITGSRSLISYLFTPITDSAYKAFREE
ncbi:MAG: HlyD family type I secretion periplasmic adaptor subunit [Proteobacteria bacterium]|nr:HlyD family type I secretion periplasmic adaptor subunit [Pseudomonadota bacterium]